MGTAGKCRTMGLQVGDTIEGKEGDDKGKWWDITRLTLLWLGDEIVVWRQTHINHMSNEWSEPKEEANWSLDYRDWRKVPPNVKLTGRRRAKPGGNPTAQLLGGPC